MFDLILRNLTQRKLRTGLTIFGIALGIFAVIVMGGMSEHFNLTFDRSISLTADKIRVLPEGGFFGSTLNESKVREVRRIPGVSDSYGFFQAPLDPESLGFFGGDMVIGLPPDKLGSALKDTKLTQGRLLVSGDKEPSLGELCVFQSRSQFIRRKPDHHIPAEKSQAFRVKRRLEKSIRV